MQDQRADLKWHAAGVPVSTRFDDPYFSLENGLDETRYVFLQGNALPDRYKDGFHIAELGFGTGLNLLAAWQAWREAGVPGKLHFTSFEAFPMAPADMRQSLALFDVDRQSVDALLAALESHPKFESDDLVFEMVLGDARTTLTTWAQKADAWFLDGFSPAKNPELWGQELLQSVYDRTNDDGSAATYTAAGAVRRGLATAGFTVERIAGYGHKRHMTIARKVAS